MFPLSVKVVQSLEERRFDTVAGWYCLTRVLLPRSSPESLRSCFTIVSCFPRLTGVFTSSPKSFVSCFPNFTRVSHVFFPRVFSVSYHVYSEFPGVSYLSFFMSRSSCFPIVPPAHTLVFSTVSSV